MKLELELLEQYRSFPKDFKFIFEGPLIVLSGVNGSGKSQLLNIMSGREYAENVSVSSDRSRDAKKISRVLTLDGTDVKPDNIEIRSFKDNIKITELTKSDATTALQSATEAWSNYRRNLLDHERERELADFSDSCQWAKAILIDFFGEETYASRSIDEGSFKRILSQASFIWKRNDIFENKVGDIFYNYALEVGEEQKEVGRDNFDKSNFKKAPWEELNELFSELKFNYRFREDFEVQGITINHQPQLFSFEDGQMNLEEVRFLKDLSDGEKAIISLSFAYLNGKNLADKKLVLLDEYDAVLNPSLLEAFYKTLNKYFIKKNILVILTTHSPTTISLAPEDSSYYEIRNIKTDSQRIVKVSKEEYSELKIAYQQFYERIREYKDIIHHLNSHLSTKDILIITEGKTDWKHIISALRHFNSRGEYQEIKETFFLRFGSQYDVDNRICETEFCYDLSDSKLEKYLNSLIETRQLDSSLGCKIRVGIFDSDTNIKNPNDPSLAVFSTKIEPYGSSIEHLYTTEELRTKVDNRRLYFGHEFDEKSLKLKVDPTVNIGLDSARKAGKNTVIDNAVFDSSGNNIALTKEDFAKAVYNKEVQISDKSWENFRQIFDFIAGAIRFENNP